MRFSFMGCFVKVLRVYANGKNAACQVFQA
jgi:hypothetical protein